MHRDRDFDLQEESSLKEQALTQDLDLNTLLNGMAQGDKFVFEVGRRSLLLPLQDQGSILYRQTILQDCLSHSAVVMDIYALAVEAIEREKKDSWFFSLKHPTHVLHRSVDVLEMFAEMLIRLRSLAEKHAVEFRSEGFTALFAMLRRELDDGFFAALQFHLRQLTFPNGVLVSAELGKGNKGCNYVLQQPLRNSERTWLERLFAYRPFAHKPSAYTFYLHPRDESGSKALAELRDRAINEVANALAQAKDHILGFFLMLRTELAFYIGCMNLYAQLARKAAPTSFPTPKALSERKYSAKGLYDVCLALNVEGNVIGNDLAADNKNLVIITGANQGGKSTFLRSTGLAQLMMQCGLFVPAKFFSASVCERLFTHFKREEDTTMKSGKLDEELARMSQIVDHLTPNSMVLFNESFAATNEREGSEIARQVICALLEKRIKMFFVTHLYEFAHGFYDENTDQAVFLRAERQPDGSRSFKLIEGEPLQTSYGEDLYEKIFGSKETVASR